jgi:hypothetical protein
MDLTELILSSQEIGHSGAQIYQDASLMLLRWQKNAFHLRLKQPLIVD